MAFNDICPIGETRADIRNAMLLSLIANALRDSSSMPFKITDFLLFHPFGESFERPLPSPEELKAKLTYCLGRPTKIAEQS